MIKKEKILILLIITSFFIVLQFIYAENVIYGQPIPTTELLDSIEVHSTPFYFNNLSFIYIRALNSNGDLINVDNIIVSPENLTSFYDFSVTTSVTQLLNKEYEIGYIFNKLNMNNITFNIVVEKGDKIIEKEYNVMIENYEDTLTFQDKLLKSLNILGNLIYNNWVIILIGFGSFIMLIFIIKGLVYIMS